MARKQDERSTNGKDSPGNSTQRRYKPKPQRGVADWESIDATMLRKLVTVVTRTGGAIRFGYSRDGGAYAVGILGDGDPYTVYFAPNEALTDEIEELIAAFED